jgi:hypothetical protein
VLLRRARKLAQQYFLVYQEPIPTAQLVQRVASVMQEYTQSGYGVRYCSYLLRMNVLLTMTDYGSLSLNDQIKVE